MIKDQLQIERQGRFQVVTLNRPEALNALNYEMVLGLHDILDQIQANEDILAIVLQGAGDKAFCAGGDIKAAREAAIDMREGRKNSGAVDFFAAEYGLNKKLFHYQKPIVALMDGITMGGGVGLAAPCRYRIATPKTVWAMPEVSIGFFPDVGAAYYLNQAPDNVGVYLGLTGTALKNAGDILYCGLATHYTEAPRDKYLADILESKNEDDLNRRIENLSVQPPAGQLPYGSIKAACNGDTLAEILSAMNAQTVSLIKSKSPISVAVAFRYLQWARGKSFDDIIAMDFHLAQKFLIRGDMVEGIRAMVVDKDRNPQWRREVTDAELDWYFN